MIRDAIKLILSGVISAKLWVAAALANVGTLVLATFLDDQLFPQIGDIAKAVLGLAFVIGVIGLFATLWKLTRTLGMAKSDEQGAVGPWIGWSIIALLPALLLIIALEFGSDAPLPWWINSFIFSVTMCLNVPITVHANGKAINANGLSIGEICFYWLKNYPRLFVAYLLISLPFILLSDAIDWYALGTKSDAIWRSIMSSTLNFISALLGIAITVTAYREAEASRLPSTG